MKQLKVEFFVGLFVIAGFIGVSYMAINMGNIQWLSQQNTYQLTGRFSSVSGLKEGASVEMAGVKVGKVVQIVFDPDRFQAIVTMDIPNTIKLPLDSVASVRTTGIIGDKFIKVSSGADEEFMTPGSEFEQTESSMDIEALISKFVFIENVQTKNS